ncbi:MAG: 4-hydroxy-tetrahydrodipicolinate reductase [Proteobacteria bacterium]|nr:4-hydroxy-tetrahydrodipicolinate reductase [Pseudomonadota bacterium]
MIRLAVLGPSGRMGRLVIELVGDHCDPDTAIVSAVDAPDSPLIGREVVPGVVVTSDLDAGLTRADVYIDFTTPESTRLAAQAARAHRVAGVIGTTGLDPATDRAIDELATHAPVVVAANFSLGVNVLSGLVKRAARALGPEFDLEIVEIHHKHKRDAPSGTALALAESLVAGRGTSLRNRPTREGDVGARSPDEIGVMAVRGGDVAGEHTVYFLGPNERLELTHRSGSRRIFAQGALHAARWVAGQPAGRYDMNHVLDL